MANKAVHVESVNTISLYFTIARQEGDYGLIKNDKRIQFAVHWAC